MSHFKYSHLDTAKHEIRLMYSIADSVSTADQTSTPGVEELPLRCILKTVSLDENPPYTALSYAWGSTDIKKQIILNGETFTVTQNLETALQHLHRESRPEGLWIDSVCINQVDDKEKTEQVQQMKSIYESANEVVVWLGPAAGNSDIIMDLLAEIGKQACEFGLPDSSQPGRLQWPASETDKRVQVLKTSFKQFIDKAGHMTLIEAFSSFVARPWWKRVWVVQELAVAKNAIFGLGDKRVPYAYVYAAVHFWTSESIITVLSKYHDENMLEVDKDKVFHALAHSSIYPAIAMLSHPRWYRGDTLTKSTTLFNLLLRALIGGTDGFRLLATDKRDYIYGLLGLADDVLTLGVVPDYSLQWTDVYIEVARKLIQAGHVDIIALCQKKTLNLSDGMPSWTPDWRAGIEEPIMEPFVASGAAIAQPFSASGRSVAATPLSDSVARNSEGISTLDSAARDMPSTDSSRAITLSGTCVDVVQEKGTAYGFTDEPGEDALGIMVTLFSDVESFSQKSAALNHHIYSSLERRKEAFWRVPIRDLEGSLSMPGMNVAGRATKVSSARYKKFRSITKSYECYQKSTAPPTPTTRGMSYSGDRRWPPSFLWLSKSILFLQAIYFLAKFFISRGNWLSKAAWWIRSRMLLCRGWLLDRDADARNAMREKINSKWDAVLQEKPDAYFLTMTTSYKRRPFLTSRGYVGLGPEHLSEGDVTCVLHGGTVPFILRPRRVEQGGGYYVVGEAYVDGIMDGEFMDTKPRIENFVLY